jgi:hypothetical protein
MKKILALTSLVILTGCLNHNMQKVSTGMTKQEVIELLGEPNSASAKDDFSCLYFTIHDNAFGRKENNYYFAFSTEGKLVEFGPLPEVQQEHGMVDKHFKGITNTAKTAIDSIGHAVNPEGYSPGEQKDSTQPANSTSPSARSCATF